MSDNRTAELLPCPFCGGEASRRLFYKGKYRVHCNACDAHSGDVCDTEAEAIAAWNARAELGSEPPYDELLRCLENDWHIHASWDGLRKFWCIELTEEGVRVRDAELGSEFVGGEVMSEYIVDMYSEAAGVKCEPVVRCRDCKWFYCLTIDACVCERSGEKFMPWVEPDGFCAWGKRKEAENGI